MTLHPTRTLLADDHALLLEMLRSRLEAEDDFDVVAAVMSGDAALEAGTRQPIDLAVMDIDMPGMSVFEVARRLHDVRPELQVVLLSAFVTDAYVELALEVKASGYLTKSEPPEAFMAALRNVIRGRTCYSPAVRQRMVVDVDGLRLEPSGPTRARHLTTREREVLLLLAQGKSKKATARALDISMKTVDHHAEHLMLKLDIHDRVELARFAIREGMIHP